MRRCACLFALALAWGTSLRGDELADLVKDLSAASQEAGSAKARAAWDRVVRHGPRALPRLLEAMDTTDLVAANWLRLAFDAIIATEEKAGGKGIDVDALLPFVRDPKRQGRARRLALDLVERHRPGTRAKLLDGWLDDPEFGHAAVERLLARIEADRTLPRAKLAVELRRAFAASRDLAQARLVADRLREQGVTVSVADHLGFLADWYVIGPLDGKNQTGFRTVYPPERGIDLTAQLDGKEGKKLTWQRLSVAEARTGRVPILVDLRRALGDTNDAVGYAWTAFRVPEARDVEFRGAADDNFTVWVNGKRVFAFEEYQNGVRLDRHRFKVHLRAGENTVLVKVCQVPFDRDNHTPNWEFLLRITDPSGRGLTFPSALKPR